MKLSVEGKLRLALKAAIVAGLGVAAGNATAQDAPTAGSASSIPADKSPTASADDGIETIYVTGSSIRRIKGETSLPVQVIDAEAIAKTGVTSVADLVRKLPALQGGTVESSSIGGNSYGFAGVDVHNQGENHTLVLLNGRRLAQFGGQTLTGFAAAMDLNAIPVSAIERVEILTDGASALYGSDAVAGVVNFITKKKQTDGGINVQTYRPDGGAEETGVSISKGIGDYAKDGWNLFVAASTEKRKELRSVERSYADSALIDFNYGGQRWAALNGISNSAIPANARSNNPESIYNGLNVNPFQLTTGACPELTIPDGPNCYMNTTPLIQIYPERERHTGSASFNLKIAEDHNFFTDFLISRTKSVSKIAPVPGQVPIAPDSELYQTYLAPLRDPNGVPIFIDDADANGDGIPDNITASYRVFDLGPRVSDDKADFYHVASGFDGVAAGWDYNVAYTQSESKVEGSISGYPGGAALTTLLRSGQINPFLGIGEQTPEGLAALQAINYNGYWDGGVSKLQTVELRGSRQIYEFANGNAVSLGAGLNYFKEKFQSKPSQFAQANLDDPVAGTPAAGGPGTGDQRFGDAAAQIPYGANRDVFGAYAEILAQPIDMLELSFALRYDDYDDVGDTTNFKAGFKLTPATGVLLRGSYGTGFKAPSVPQLNASPQSYGVTAEPYTCGPELEAIADGLGAICRPPESQYDVFAGGNQDLKPEKSRQATLGAVFEPSRGFSFGADLWWVAIEDVFGQIAEQEAFANPTQYDGAWTTFTDPVTRETYLAYNQTNLNLGKQYTTGVDYDIRGTWDLGFGTFRSQLLATQLLSSKSQLQPGGAYYYNLDNYSEQLGNVSFTWQARVQNTLVIGKWTHDVGLNYKSGYEDVTTDVVGLDENGDFNGEEGTVALRVSPYFTVDWQSSWNVIKPLTITVGALNLFDKDPPLSLTTANFPVGYDARYYDPRGVTPYAKLLYTF